VNSEPYVSVAFVNRNDGYGGDLETRIEKFIEYYASYVRRWPGLFEFVICDWNPPEDRPRLPDAFRWKELGKVTHVEVPHKVHARIAGTKGRKMLDYIGRNVAIRRGCGQFSLVLNQDIFVSQSILELIARKNLSQTHFYRADRCDFDFAPCRSIPIDRFEIEALNAVFFVHRRHRSSNEPISIDATKAVLNDIGSGPEFGDHFDKNTGVIYCRAASRVRRRDRWRRIFDFKWLPGQRSWRRQYYSNEYYRGFFLHTNASGDFILAPRMAFFKVHGMPETTEFYMHLDTYAIVQLFAAGYEQAVFAQPHRVYHADHDRSGRADFKEGITFEEHELELSKILRGERSYRLNDSDWGLANLPLPARRVDPLGVKALA